MAEKISKVSLDGILELKEKGKRLSKIEELQKPFEDKDIKIKAIVNSKNKIYFYEDKFWFYGYERDNKIRFDSDDHPYFNAYFGQKPQNSFKLYDGYFLGRYGCGGSHRGVGIIERVYNLITASNSRRHKELLDEFDSFYDNIKDNEVYELKEEFGLCNINPKKILESKTTSLPLCEKEKKFIIAFGNWYGQFINKNGEYNRKIKVVRKKEHETAFKKYIQETIKKLEINGFKKCEKYCKQKILMP